MNKLPIVVSVGGVDIEFNADHEDFNQFLNETSATDKVTPAFNLLSRTVAEGSRAAFNSSVLTEANRPKGVVVLQIAAIVTTELGAGVEIVLKKPNAVLTA